MRTYDPDWPLFSIHIPKCAGTSLRHVLSKWFGDRFYLHHSDQSTGAKPVRHDLSIGVPKRRRWLLQKPYPPRVCVHGHFNHDEGYGVLDYYPDARQFVTMLRDPFDIALSIYFFSKARGDKRIIAGKPRPMRAEFPDLSSYVEREVLNKPSIIPSFMPFQLELKTLERDLNERFVYVGLAEDSNKSMERLAQRLGLPYIAMPRSNESSWDEPIPDGARDIYRRQHPTEYALYDYVSAHYLD